MAKHLTRDDINKIARLIQGIKSGDLTWEFICDAVADSIGKRPSRQSLCKHVDIMSAYRHCKTNVFQCAEPIKKPASLSIAAQRIKRLELEVVELQRVNRNLHEHFLKLQYNAYLHDLKEWQLTADLPMIDRERTYQK